MHVWLYVLLCSSLLDIASSTRGTQLETKIFTNYSARIRPAATSSDKTTIYMTMFVQHIEAVDDWRQTMKIHGALHMYWYDYRLQWNPAEYNNTDSIYTRAFRVWTPDVRILNSVDGLKPLFYENRHDLILLSSGFASFTQDFTVRVSCPLTHRQYPHDRQKCPIVLTSLMYDYSSIDWMYGWAESQPATVEIRLDWRNPKRHMSGWQLLNVTARKAYLTRNGIQYATTPAGGGGATMRWAWPMVVIDVEVQRHKPYFYLCEATPMLMMAILTTASFWVDGAPLVTLALLMSVLIGQGYYSWDLFKELPPGTDGTPKLAIAYAFNFGMSSMAFILHIAIQYLYESSKTSTGSLPPFLAIFVNRIDRNPMFRGPGIRLFPSQPSQSGLSALDTDGEHPIGQMRGVRMRKFALVTRRVFFWAFVVTYSIFVIALAV